jgi:hypothetical protein
MTQVNNGMFAPVGVMAVADARLQEAKDEAKRWKLSSMVSSGVCIALAVAIGVVAGQRDEARDIAVQMYPGYIKSTGPTAYILPCPCGEMDISGMEWLPTKGTP